ncbi:Uncharacterised protein [Bordetella pertussis]|nr:Uncharacterised protein [Bordetella pertussis]
MVMRFCPGAISVRGFSRQSAENIFLYGVSVSMAAS